MAATVETARTRRRQVEEAGWRTTSFVSILAGTLVAFGAVTIVAAGAGAAGSALGLDTDGISTNEWRQAGIAGAVIGALVVLGAFYFGGYTAGRMGRRAGARHGLLVFVLSALLIGAIALVTWAMSGDVSDSLRDQGVPTDADTWVDIGIGAAIATGAAMLLGSILGGIRGDRWHGRLATAIVEHRDEVREAEADHTRREAAIIGDTPVDHVDHVDHTEAIDLTDDDRTEVSVEEERDPTRTTPVL